MFRLDRVRARVFEWLSFFVVGIAASSSLSAQTLVAGHTPGEFSVTPSGAATYSIPIQVPPGVAGLVPNLSLNYSSQADVGVAGLGWSLEGSSTITRCPLSKATDGIQSYVKLDAGDRFCLDGQRLLVVSGGYGAAGSEYRTEMDQFSRITANGAAGGIPANGPESFTVRTKDGRILQFGASDTSRIEAQGKTVVSVWALTSISDIKGNAIGFGYSEYTNGEWYLVAVSWGAGSRSVQLTYEPRLDVYQAYRSGSVEFSSLRLKQIETRVGSVPVQRLKLAYDASSSIHGSRLTSAQLCDKDEKCLAPTTFGWKTVGSDAYTNAVYTSHSGGKDNNITADLNGDGRSDMMSFTGPGNWNVCLSAGSAAALAFSCSSWAGPAVGVTGVLTGDYNGDGRADIAAFTGTTNRWQVCLSTGTNFSCSYWYGNVGGVGSNVVGDFDGDGRSDMAYHVGSGSWNICRSTGSGFTCSAWASHPGGKDNNITADYNGDGLDDMMRHVSGTTWSMCLSSGTGFSCSSVSAHTGGVAKSTIGDFNGDGLKDLVGFLGTPGSGTAPWRVCLNTGVGFSCSDWTAHNAGLQGAVGDYNGDERTDLAAYNASLGQWRMCLSTGTGFNCTMWSGAVHNNAQGDYNGDGIDDFAAAGSGANWYLSFSLKNERPLIQTITRGGVSTAIEYHGMAAPGQLVYTKELWAAYPHMDIQAPMWLVRRTTMSNGVGGVNATRYHYGGMRAEHASAAGRGRGNQGFRWSRIYEETSQMEAHTWYAQDWPYTGQVTASETRRSGAAAPNGMLKRTDTLFGCYQTTGATPTTACPAGATGVAYHIYPVKVTEQSVDFNGQSMPTVETYRELTGTAVTGGALRQLGDLTRLQVDILFNGTLRHRKATVNEFHPAKTTGTDWQIGRLKKATVTSASYETTPTSSGAVSYVGAASPLGPALTASELADFVPKFLHFLLNDD